jgi:putative phage-type endonuclease
MEQRSPDWYAARVGKVTASRVADVVAKTRTGWGASRATYMGELIAERMTGKPSEGFESAAMRWGTETEPQARAAYEFFRDTSVTEVGFVDHPRITMSGASPDGLVGEDGLVEIKCPNTITHIDTLLARTVPQKYQLQMLWQMACTGRTWCDYVSFDPRMPEHLRLCVIRFDGSPQRIAELEADVETFLREIAEKVMRLGAL